MDGVFARRLFLAFTISMLSACAEDEKIHIPADQGTPTQHEQVEKTIQEITELFEAEGEKLRIATPVIISFENLDNNSGLCMRDAKGNPIFIQLSPSLMQWQSRGVLSPLESPLFAILLHEVGHCYFGRVHTRQLLGFSTSIMLFKDSRNSRRNIYLKDIPISIMSQDYGSGIPRALRSYYVREILGKDELRSLEDLQRYTDVELMPSSAL